MSSSTSHHNPNFCCCGSYINCSIGYILLHIGGYLVTVLFILYYLTTDKIQYGDQRMLAYLGLIALTILIINGLSALYGFINRKKYYLLPWIFNTVITIVCGIAYGLYLIISEPSLEVLSSLSKAIAVVVIQSIFLYVYYYIYMDLGLDIYNHNYGLDIAMKIRNIS